MINRLMIKFPITFVDYTGDIVVFTKAFVLRNVALTVQCVQVACLHSASWRPHHAVNTVIFVTHYHYLS